MNQLGYTVHVVCCDAVS